MVDICTLTGIIRRPDGTPLGDAALEIHPDPADVRARGTFLTVPVRTVITTASNGFATVALAPGTYKGTGFLRGERFDFVLGVPDVAVAALEDWLGLDVVVLTNAEAAAAQSQLAATISSEQSVLSAIARIASEAARDSAAIISLALGTFPTIAAGISAAGGVPLNSYFWVALGGGLFRLYRHTTLNTVATDQGIELRDLSAAVIPAYETTAQGNAIDFTAVDGSGRDVIIGSISSDGDFAGKSFTAETVAAISMTVGGASVPTVELYEVSGEGGGILIVDTDNRIIASIPDNLTTGGGGGGAVAIDDILAFDATIDLTGSADMSARLKSAHDAAFAAGLKHLFIEGPLLAPTALFLGDVLFLTRSGKGRLIDTYRKRVVPVSAPTAPMWSRIFPERHLKRLRTKLLTATPADPAIIVYMSDSWGQPNQLVGQQSQWESYLKREMVRQFGADASKIRIVNRAIGGTVWTDATGTLVQGAQS